VTERAAAGEELGLVMMTVLASRVASSDQATMSMGSGWEFESTACRMGREVVWSVIGGVLLWKTREDSRFREGLWWIRVLLWRFGVAVCWGCR
jgi:hypothetical protein